MYTLPGSLAVLFYMAHGAYFLYHGESYHLLWTCHVGCLFVGLGIIFRKSLLNSVGFFWVTIGIPLWIINLLSTDIIYTSILTHLGGFIIGLYGLKQLGLPKRNWIYALISMILFAGLSRFFTPAKENINLVFSVWKGWEKFYPSYWIFGIIIVLYIGISYFILDLLLRRVFLNRFVKRSL